MYSLYDPLKVLCIFHYHASLYEMEHTCSLMLGIVVAQWVSNTLHAPDHDRANSENGAQDVMATLIVPTGLMSQTVIYTMGLTFTVMEIVVSL